MTLSNYPKRKEVSNLSVVDIPRKSGENPFNLDFYVKQDKIRDSVRDYNAKLAMIKFHVSSLKLFKEEGNTSPDFTRKSKVGI